MKTATCWALATGMVLSLTAIGAAADGEAKQILDAAGVQGGLILHVGCEDGKLTAALHADDKYVVHGLDVKEGNVAAARRHADSLGLSGKVSFDTFDGKRLPFADNLVNLIVAERIGDVPMDEVMRVLAPLGVAHIGGKKTVKPWPDAIDEWTHYLHDATGNAVAHDRVVAAPKRLQWIGGPLWSRSHEYDSSLCAMVSARGRLFYIFDEGPTGVIDKRIPDKWALIARDAFSGVILWKRPIPLWGWKAWKRAMMEQADWSRIRSQRNQLPPGVARRLVAAGDRIYVTLGYEAPVTALDAATGQTLTTYAGTERTDEIIHDNGVLVLRIRTAVPTPKAAATGKKRRGKPQPVIRGSIVALDAADGRRLWEVKTGTVAPLSLMMSGGRVFYSDGGAIVCLDAASGKQLWRTAAAGGGTTVVYRNVVLCAGSKQLVAMSAKTGKEMWKLPGARGYGVANPPDLFVADGLVWYNRGRPEVESMTGYDPWTGKAVRTVNVGPVITHGHHARCYRSKATDNYLLLPKRATEFIDLQGTKHSRHNWVRGACRYGVLPCNGLLYATPHPCFCYAGVKLGGFMGLSGQTVKLPSDNDAPRLTKGPAYSTIRTPQSAIRNANAWPMYRHNPKRSGSTPTNVDPSPQPVWDTKPGGKLTQPVVVGQRLFTARVHAGQILCLSAETGKDLWTFSAGGRIDSSPTYYRGRLVFGSADGNVYCLRASDGVLAWKFRAAPADRRVVAFGQVESAWPVHGSVLIMNDLAYVTAGRSSFLDGGIFLYGLDPVTGEKRYEARIDGPHPNVKVRDEGAYAMEGAKSDLLVTDGELIYLFYNAFNARLEKQPTPVKGKLDVRNLGVRDFGLHLFSNAGFLDETWFNRNHWLYDSKWTAFNFTHQSPKAGQLVVFDDDRTYAVKVYSTRNVLSPQFFPATDGYYLVADRNDNQPVVIASDGKGGPKFLRWLPQTEPLQTCWNLGVGFARAKPAAWMNNLPVRIRAMVRTNNALFAAGPPDVLDPDDPTAALEGRTGAVLMSFDPKDGKKLFECKLDTPPAFDGMSAAGGRLYMVTVDGRVRCFGKTK
jgi:outer membrane protein assembly factor BamB